MHKATAFWGVLAATLLVLGCESETSSPAQTLNNIGKGQWQVSGKIYDTGGTALSGVKVELVRAVDKLANLTNDKGEYTFLKVENDTYNVKPSRSGYTFTPDFRDVTVNGADLKVADFTGKGSSSGGSSSSGGADASSSGASSSGGSSGGGHFSSGQTLIGEVVFYNPRYKTEGGGLHGMKVTISNGTDSASTYTMSGTFRFDKMVPPGKYTITGSREGWFFIRDKVDIVVGDSQYVLKKPEFLTAHSTFILPSEAAKEGKGGTLAIEFTGENGKKNIYPANVMLTRPDYKQRHTSGGGEYMRKMLGTIMFGKYRIHPTTDGLKFSPPYIDYDFAAMQRKDRHFNIVKPKFVVTKDPTAKYFTYTLSGRVLDSDGKGLEKAQVTVQSNGASYNGMALTKADGTWKVDEFVAYTEEAFLVHVRPYELDVKLKQPFTFVEHPSPTIVVPDIQ